MKQTPLYELSVAIKDRPKTFQVIVIGCFFFSLLFTILCVSDMVFKEQTYTKTNADVRSNKTYNTTTVRR